MADVMADTLHTPSPPRPPPAMGISSTYFEDARELMPVEKVPQAERTRNEASIDERQLEKMSRHLAVTSPSTTDAVPVTHTEKIIFSRSSADFKKIQDKTVQLVVWRRTVIPAFVKTLSDASIRATAIPFFFGIVQPTDFTTQAKMIKDHMYGKLEEEAALSESEIDELIKDIQQLIRMFAQVTDASFVKVRLEVVDTDGCLFWHQDSVPYRLITTYRGPCTEYVHPDLSQKTLRRRKGDSPDALSLTHHDVAFWKGIGSPHRGIFNHPGIVHRSPKLSGTGVTRLVLVLDKAHCSEC